MKNENKAKERIGEESISTNGQKMTIIAYRSSQDIDVQFEDGNIVKNKSYAHFKDGKITQQSLQKDKRLGETKMMKCGKNATIIEYNCAHDMTIKFEDGVIVKHKYYTDFVRGTIKHPNIPTNCYAIKTATGEKICSWAALSGKKVKEKYKKIHLNETNTAKNGQLMTITKYNKANDIEITFDDGTVVKNQRYEKFQRGEIVNPNNKIVVSTSLNEYTMLFYLKKIGFKKAKQGSLKSLGLERLEIDAFHKNKKIGIEYDGNVHGFRPNTDIRKDKLCKENGIMLIRIREKLKPSSKDTINFLLLSDRPFSEEYEKVLQNVCDKLTEFGFKSLKINFKKDKDKIMKNFENEYIVSHIGEEYTNSKGEHYVITRYIGCNEVYVKFDDGTEKKCTYDNLKRKTFTKKTQCRNLQKRIGEERVMNCGMKAKIVAYHSSSNIDVELENGILIKHRTYGHFKEGKISLSSNGKENRLGETRTMNCGKKATIIAYNDSHNIDVQFEDGTIVKHKNYGSFQTGKIAIPANNKESRTGETKMMNCGMNATIINYNKAHDIDIQFEDGIVLKHKSYTSFKNGEILNPNLKRHSPNKSLKRIGEVRTMKCGLNAEIIDYRSSRDIDVKFEDGVIIEHKAYILFKNGYICHPNYKNKKYIPD